jgi:hypothetical protein
LHHLADAETARLMDADAADPSPAHVTVEAALDACSGGQNRLLALDILVSSAETHSVRFHLDV